MRAEIPKRKVVFLEDRRAIADLLFVLLTEAGCETEDASLGRHTLATIPQHSFDRIMLDLRCADSPHGVVSAVTNIRPEIVGRVLCLACEAANRQTLEWLESRTLVHVRQRRKAHGFWNCLRWLLGAGKSAAALGNSSGN